MLHMDRPNVEQPEGSLRANGNGRKQQLGPAPLL